MTRRLPQRPSFPNLRNQAKNLLKSHREKDPDSCGVLKLLHRFAECSNDEILSSELTLSEAQYATALSYGFKSWRELKENVEGKGSAHRGQTISRENGGILLNGMDSFEQQEYDIAHLRAIACVLKNCGEQVNWHWLVGVSGEAFCYYYHPDGTFLSEFVHSWDIVNTALNPYGYSGKWHFQQTEADTSVMDRIEAEVSAGRLAIAPGIMPTPDGQRNYCHRWYVVRGVNRKENMVWLLGENGAGDGKPVKLRLSKAAQPQWIGIARTFKGMDSHYVGSSPLVTIEKMQKAVPTEASVVDSLRRAMALMTETSTICQSAYGSGTYLAGMTALKKLYHDLLTAEGNSYEEFIRLNPTKGDPFRGLGDELQFLELLSWRRDSASKFFLQLKRHLPEGTHTLMEEISDKFRKSSKHAFNAFEIRYGDKYARLQLAKCFRENRIGDEYPEWVNYWKPADDALGNKEKRKSMASHVSEIIKAEEAIISLMGTALLPQLQVS